LYVHGLLRKRAILALLVLIVLARIFIAMHKVAPVLLLCRLSIHLHSTLLCKYVYSHVQTLPSSSTAALVQLPFLFILM
jgi:uncharacterized membrane protein